MAVTDKAFGLVIFKPDKIYTNVASNELLITGEGMTARVSLSDFIANVDWPTLSTQYNIWRKEQDRIRKEKWDARSKRQSVDVSR